MVERSIVKIDEEKCNGCGKCIAPCAEGAIEIIDGKAKIVSEDLCDGMGFCVGVCPTGALSVESRQTLQFNSEKAAQTPKRSDSSIYCNICERDELERYLIPVRHDNDSIWICTKCLPSLIH
ncbi:ATP-binding protein [Methanosalsum natronophilum]|uniref:Ferredoxin n=1 Tax=Methanosalsum natronophilum TaxID=768733 RepID=A0A424YUG3_9EURY|nr:4Fe-4S dicluster-binding protein [Methanosalsum natronophilum]MCS3923649.1 Na+-translocating ferredoxin:NAD+ oxidoreductase RNF subunit RnfB [Methanosalsum natronophilum]RQD82624.1 MAG: ferredoxin [Methanosalsum natronophilum]